MKPFAVFNPNDQPEHMLPVIYGFNNGGSAGGYMAELMAEDGTMLGGHFCSSEGFMYHDLGILEGTRPDRHEGFRRHYPDGYRMAFVTEPEVIAHSNPGFEAACLKNQEQGHQADAQTEDAELA